MSAAKRHAVRDAARSKALLDAAAPELFETLQEMLTAFSMENIGVNASLRRINAKKAARNALAKARGDA